MIDGIKEQETPFSIENTKDEKYKAMELVFLKLASDAFYSSESYVDSYLRKQWEDGLKQWQSQHPDGSKYKSDTWKGKSKLFRPRTRSVIRKNEAAAAAAYFSTADVVNVSPQDDNNELDQLSAEIISGILNYRLTNNIPWFQICIGAYQNSQVYGQVCSYQYWKYNEQTGHDEPAIDLRPIENIRIDPAADWLDPVNSSPYFIDLIPMYIMDVQEKMESGEWIEHPETDLLAAAGNYSDSTRIQREGRDDSKSNNHTQNNKFSTVWVRRNIIKYKGVDWLFYTLGDSQLLTEPEELKTIGGKRPYVIGNCIVEANRTNPSSICDLTRNVQKEINNVTNQRMDNVLLALNKRYHAKRNKKVDLRSLTRNVAGSVTLMDDLNDVKVFDVPDVTSSSFREQDLLNLDFDDLAGVFSGSSVQANRNLNETVGGMNLMSQSANQLGEYQLRTFNETWVEPVLKQVMMLIIEYEDDETILAIAGGQSKVFIKQGFKQVTDDMLTGKTSLTVNVGTGATNPQTQVERFFYGMNAMAGLAGDQFLQKLELEEITKEVFGKLGYKDGARFFKNDEEVNPEVQQLQAQLQQSQQQLDLKYDPAEQEAKIKKLNAEANKIEKDAIRIGHEGVNKKVEAMFSAMNTAEKIAMNQMIANIGDDILDSAGYEDSNGGEIVETPIEQSLPITPSQENTNPLTPANPEVGLNTGIESGEIND